MVTEQPTQLPRPIPPARGARAAAADDTVRAGGQLRELPGQLGHVPVHRLLRVRAERGGGAPHGQCVLVLPHPDVRPGRPLRAADPAARRPASQRGDRGHHRPHHRDTG